MSSKKKLSPPEMWKALSSTEREYLSDITRRKISTLRIVMHGYTRAGDNLARNLANYLTVTKSHNAAFYEWLRRVKK